MNLSQMLFIHGHIWVNSSIATQYNIPVVITSHGPDITEYCESDKFHKQANQAAKECKKIIDKIITIPNGYNPEVFYREKCNKEEVLDSFNINKKYDKIICLVGRLNYNKGIDVLLNSAKIYEKDNILTLIVGQGDAYEELNQLKEKLGLKNVVFVGNQDHENLRKIYNISDVCVVPSREEAFGLVALEAIACGTPVIATRQGGMLDFVTKDVGILVEKENVEELSTEIEKVLKEEVKFDKEYLQMYAKNNYSQEMLLDKLLNVYDEVRGK